MIRRKLLVVGLALLLMIGASFVGAQTCGEHLVAAGETLFGIAQTYNTTVDALVAANNIANASQIFAGQRLVIPCASAPADQGGLALITPANAEQVEQVFAQEWAAFPVELGVSEADIPLLTVRDNAGVISIFALDNLELPLMSVGGEDGRFIYNMATSSFGSGLAVAEYFDTVGGTVVTVSGFPTPSDPTMEITIPLEQAIALEDMALDGDLLFTIVGDITGFASNPDFVPGVQMWPLLHGLAGDLFIPNEAPVKGIVTSQTEFARLVAVGSLDGVVRVWNISSFASLFEPGEAIPLGEISPANGSGFMGTSSSMAFSPDGNFLAMGDDDGGVWLWNVGNRSLQYLSVLDAPVNAVAFSPDSTVLAMSGGILPGAEGGEPIVQDNAIHLFDVNIFASGVGGAFLNTLSGHTDAVTGLAFSPDGTHLISIAYDSTWRLWGVPDGGAVGQAAEQPTVAFSAQPQTVAFSDSVTLSWSVQNMGGVVITRQNNEGRVDIPVMQDRRMQGSYTYTLSDEDLSNGGQVAFYLGALDNNGNPVNAPGFPQAVMITISQPGSGCSHTFFFGESGDCVDSAPSDIAGAYQYFEGGYLLWHSARGSILVLHSDDTVQSFPDTWNGQLIVTDSLPPADRFVPERGFGWVWADHIGVRERLGWALGVEQAYTMRWQSGHVDSPDPRPPGVEYYQWHTGDVLRLTYYDGAVLWNWV